MSKEAANQMHSQIESTVAGPARTYANLMLDHIQQLTSLQLEAARAYADTGLQQARDALDVKDPSDLHSYVENQQKVAQALSERFKSDVEKVTSLNQTFAQNAQKIAEDSARDMTSAAEEATEKAAQAVEKGTRKSTQAHAKSQ